MSTEARFIPLSVPWLAGREGEYLKECIDTGWVSSVGPFVARFERELATWVGTKEGVAVVSGTAALHIALQLSGVGPGDEVLVSTLTFIAPANTVRYLGAWPVFVDAEPAYWQMDVERLADFLAHACQAEGGALINRATGRRVRAILPVHILGHPCDLDPLLELARRYDLAVIEDATEALGTRYRERAVGSHGQMGCFSFNGNKIVTAGGGGMIVTNDRELAGRARYLTQQAKDDPLEFVHHEIGYNYRLTNIQAALACAQLELLPEILQRKRRIADRYRERLAELPGITPMPEAPWATSSFWLYTVLIDEARFGLSSRGLLRELRARCIDTRPLWQPMHRSPAHAGAYAVGGEVADDLNHRALSLPCSAGLTEEEQDRVIRAIAAVQGQT